MPVGFKIDNTEFDALYVRREFFQEGNLWAWGYNNYGQLGTGNITDYSSPVQTVASGLNWKTITCTTTQGSAGGIKTDGTLWLWGDNQWGQLGDNTTTNRSSPVQTVAAGTNWKQVSMGRFNTGAIKTDGTLWLWGRNNNGQLGDNSTTQQNSPVQTIAGGTNWKQVSGGIAAIKTDGTLWLWGDNS
jgi:alpha-tubulin suppressor-like RCC1 family protein